MTIRDHALATALLAIAGIVVFVEPAFAQGVGAGGGQSFVNWLLGPIGVPIIAVAVALTGILMMAGRHSLEHMVWTALGGTVFGGALTIAGFFATG